MFIAIIAAPVNHFSVIIIQNVGIIVMLHPATSSKVSSVSSATMKNKQQSFLKVLFF